MRNSLLKLNNAFDSLILKHESTPENSDSSTQNIGAETSDEITTAAVERVTDDAQNYVSNVQVEVNNNPETTNLNTGAMKNEQSCGFQTEKPKSPKFSSDVREYAIFRADFKHTIESRYSINRTQ